MKKYFLLALLLVTAVFVNAQDQKTEPKKSQGQDVKVVINVADLNTAITSYVKKNYEGYKIEKAMSLQTNGVATKYKTTIKNNEEVRILSFDKDFKFLSVFDPKREKNIKIPSDKNK